MNLERMLKSTGYETFERLLKKLESNGEFIEELPYPLRLNQEVILEAVKTYPKAIKYIDMNYASNDFLVDVFINNMKAFTRFVNCKLDDEFFKQAIRQIPSIKNLESDPDLQDGLYSFFYIMPINFILKNGELLRKYDFDKYYSSETYVEKYVYMDENVIEKLLAFECSIENYEFNKKNKLRIIVEYFIPVLGKNYFEIFAKYIESNYSVNDIININKKPSFINSGFDEFILYYIKNFFDTFRVIKILYCYFDNTGKIERLFDYNENSIINYFSLLLGNVYGKRNSFANELFKFLVKNTNIDVFKLVKMFKNEIHSTVILQDKCDALIESYNYLLDSVTDVEDRKFLESIVK